MTGVTSIDNAANTNDMLKLRFEQAITEAIPVPKGTNNLEAAKAARRYYCLDQMRKWLDSQRKISTEECNRLQIMVDKDNHGTPPGITVTTYEDTQIQITYKINNPARRLDITKLREVMIAAKIKPDMADAILEAGQVENKPGCTIQVTLKSTTLAAS